MLEAIVFCIVFAVVYSKMRRNGGRRGVVAPILSGCGLLIVLFLGVFAGFGVFLIALFR